MGWPSMPATFSPGSTLTGFFSDALREEPVLQPAAPSTHSSATDRNDCNGFISMLPFANRAPQGAYRAGVNEDGPGSSPGLRDARPEERSHSRWTPPVAPRSVPTT